MSATTETMERDERIRQAVVFKGEARAAVAEREGVSVATVGRIVRAATEANLDRVEAAKAKRVRKPKPAEEPKPAAPSKVATARTQIERGDVLAFNEAWTDEARKALGDVLDGLDGAVFYLPPSRTYVRVERDGKMVAAVERSRVVFPGGAMSVSLPTTRTTKEAS